MTHSPILLVFNGYLTCCYPHSRRKICFIFLSAACLRLIVWITAGPFSFRRGLEKMRSRVSLRWSGMV